MPFFSLRIKTFSRAKKQNAVAAAAYRSGENLTDDTIGIQYRYGNRGDTIKHSEILMPDGSPPPDRERLWNAVERAETRKNSRVAREVMVVLPWTLTLQEQIAIVRQFIKKEFVALGMVADFNIHYKKDSAGKGENPHCHILLTTREFADGSFGKKRRDWNDRALAELWRKAWETAVNKCPHIAAHPAEKIDRRPLPTRRAEAKAKGDFEKWWELWRLPTKHRGKPVGFDLSARGEKEEVGLRKDRETRWKEREADIAAHEGQKSEVRQQLKPCWDFVKEAWAQKPEKDFIAWLPAMATKVARQRQAHDEAEKRRRKKTRQRDFEPTEFVPVLPDFSRGSEKKSVSDTASVSVEKRSEKPSPSKQREPDPVPVPAEPEPKPKQRDGHVWGEVNKARAEAKADKLRRRRRRQKNLGV